MALSSSDILEIRNVIKEELQPVIGKLEAIRNDIEEIYDTLADLRHSAITDRKFQRLSVKKNYLR
jgi:Skp family chaperone for outer membrane proteins